MIRITVTSIRKLVLKLEQLSEMVTADVYRAAKDYALVSAKGLLRRVALESEQEEAEIQAPRKQGKNPPDDEIPF
jgi:xanthine dehydrogenase iron-sulfur cluster and FAD-binding subunit A